MSDRKDHSKEPPGTRKASMKDMHDSLASNGSQTMLLSKDFSPCKCLISKYGAMIGSQKNAGLSQHLPDKGWNF